MENLCNHDNHKMVEFSHKRGMSIRAARAAQGKRLVIRENDTEILALSACTISAMFILGLVAFVG